MYKIYWRYERQKGKPLQLSMENKVVETNDNLAKGLNGEMDLSRIPGVWIS